MGFFDDAPPPPPQPIPAPPPKRDWMGPPDGWLGGFVPERVVLGRGPEHLVTLGPMEAFATGVLLELNVTTRIPVHGPDMFGMPTEGAMRLGVAYPGGGKWQGAREFPPHVDPNQEPAAPHIQFCGGGGGGNNQRHQLWLWPLPPDGPVTFALTWQDAGIAETTAVVDGATFPPRPASPTSSGSRSRRRRTKRCARSTSATAIRARRRARAFGQ